MLSKKNQVPADNVFANPLNSNPRRSFSQTDEDGIIVNIIERLNLPRRSSFVEIGVGNGIENNTLLLATLGWSGLWVGNEDLDIELRLPDKISFLKQHLEISDFSTTLVAEIRRKFENPPELISVDIDSFDYYLVEELLKNEIKPSVFVVEYNGAFIPPIDYVIAIESNFIWREDSKYGASLAAWTRLFRKYDFRLVACTLSGINAFFVSNSHERFFSDIPSDINELYKSPNYFAQPNRGWEMSIESINLLLNQN